MQASLPNLLQAEPGPATLAVALAAAFGMGAVHALSPGHGKTLVAAYLAGTRGTIQHALLLGATVTFTHTISVFALGFAALFLTEYIMPQQLAFVLSLASGVLVIAVGLNLLRKRWHAATHHHHDHEHGGHHHHHHHDHDHHHHHHHHGDGGHHHHMPDQVTLGSLLALGASGGLAPCPSALVLMLTAISLGRIALGLTLLVSFSIGLAAVLVAIGAAVIYASRYVPGTLPRMRWAPVISAAVITVAGVIITGAALMERP